MTTERSSSYAVAWIPEATPGVNPGIVTAAFVDGSSETTLYQPQAAGTPYKAWLRLAAAPDGLPTRPMIAAEQLYPTNDFDPLMVKGNRDEGEFTLTVNIHGGLSDPSTNRPVPPPWLRLAASACGRLLGSTAGQSGGGNGSTHYSKVLDAAPNANYFEIVAGTGTVGALDEGHVFGVDFGTGTSTRDIELVRPSFCAAATEFGDVSTTTNGAEYNSTAFGFSAAPAQDDKVLFACQAQFDRRYEAATESFTFLIMRPNVDSAMLLRGCRVKSWELTSNFNEIAQMKLTILFHDYLTFGEDGTAGFGGTPTLVDEPDYYSQWPCPIITGSANMAYINNTTVIRNLAISNLSVKWESGYTRQHSNMAIGTYMLRSTEKQDVEVRFTCLYRDDWRDILGACYPMDGIYGTFPLIYWQGTKPKDIWYFALPSMHLKNDITNDGDFEGNQATEVVLGQRKYSGDNGNFAATTTVDNKFAIGVLAD
jgi:hypothetical protein